MKGHGSLRMVDLHSGRTPKQRRDEGKAKRENNKIERGGLEICSKPRSNGVVSRLFL